MHVKIILKFSMLFSEQVYEKIHGKLLVSMLGIHKLLDICFKMQPFDTTNYNLQTNKVAIEIMKLLLRCSKLWSNKGSPWSLDKWLGT